MRGRSAPACRPQPGNNRLPDWAVKWASLALGYIDLERRVLPGELLALPFPFNTYTPEVAEVQAVVSVDIVPHCVVKWRLLAQVVPTCAQV